MATDKISQDWIDDCIFYYGKVLTGKKAHWCVESDYLPIDETCEEFKYCLCDFDEENEQNPDLEKSGLQKTSS